MIQHCGCYGYNSDKFQAKSKSVHIICGAHVQISSSILCDPRGSYPSGVCIVPGSAVYLLFYDFNIF